MRLRTHAHVPAMNAESATIGVIIRFTKLNVP